MKMIYPAIFKKMKDEDGEYYHVYFPDFMGAATDGNTIEEAFKNAKEVLALQLCRENIQTNNECDFFSLKLKKGEFALLVDADDLQSVIHASNRNPKQNKEYVNFIINKAKEKKYSLKDVEMILNLEEGYFQKLYDYNGIPDELLAKRIAFLLGFDYKILLKQG